MPRKAPHRKPTRREGTNYKCEPLSQILVDAFAPGTKPADWVCTSDAPFLVYCSTNFSNVGAPPDWGYSVSVKSTGASNGTGAPLYIVGGGPNEVVTFRMLPGTTGFITLQTACGAKASITVKQ
jgi:hypothetical protein